MKEIALRGKECIIIKVPDEWNNRVYRTTDDCPIKHCYEFNNAYDDQGRQIFRYIKTVDSV